MRARPLPKERARQARSQLYRQLILEAAERTFASQGVEETRMEAIAAESGLSLGTLYSVFPGKADLVRAIHETRLREMLQQAVDLGRERDDPLELLLRGVRSYVGYFVAHPDYLRMHLREGYSWGLNEAAAPAGERAAAWSEGVAILTGLFRRGIESGVFHAGDPEVCARLMIAMQQVQLAVWVEDGMRRERGELIAEVEAQVRRSFCKAALR